MAELRITLELEQVVPEEIPDEHAEEWFWNHWQEIVHNEAFDKEQIVRIERPDVPTDVTELSEREAIAELGGGASMDVQGGDR